VTLLGRPYPTWRVCRAFDQIPPHIARSVPPLRRDGSGAAAALCDAGGPRKYIAMRGRQDPNAMFERMAGLRCIKPLCNTTVTQTAFAACVRTPMLGANSADPGGDRRSRGCRRRMHCSRYVARARHEACSRPTCKNPPADRARAIHSVPTGTAKTLLSTAEPGATVKARG
jgi:hypothetical protein